MTMMDLLIAIEALINAGGKFLMSVGWVDPVVGLSQEVVLAIPGINKSVKIKSMGGNLYLSWASGDNVGLENEVMLPAGLPVKLSILVAQTAIHEVTPGMKLALPVSLVRYDADANRLYAYDINNSSVSTWTITFIAPPPPM